MNSSVVLIGGLALVFFLIGLEGPWRRTLGYLVSAYAALVIASQHNAFIADAAARRFGLPEMIPIQQSALVFGISLAVLFIGLGILFGRVWRPTPSEQIDSSERKGGGNKLTRAALCGSVGWALGAMLVISIATAEETYRGDVILESGVQTQQRVVYATADIVAHLIKPWLPGELPLVFQQAESPATERGSDSAPTPTPTQVLVSTPVVKLELLEPLQGETYRNPITFKWSGSLSAGQSYQVTAWPEDGELSVQSDLLTARSWSTDLPPDLYGDWRWQVSVVSSGNVAVTSSEGMFWFDPY